MAAPDERRHATVRNGRCEPNGDHSGFVVNHHTVWLHHFQLFQRVRVLRTRVRLADVAAQATAAREAPHLWVADVPDQIVDLLRVERLRRIVVVRRVVFIPLQPHRLEDLRVGVDLVVQVHAGRPRAVARLDDGGGVRRTACRTAVCVSALSTGRRRCVVPACQLPPSARCSLSLPCIESRMHDAASVQFRIRPIGAIGNAEFPSSEL